MQEGVGRGGERGEIGQPFLQFGGQGWQFGIGVSQEGVEARQGGCPGTPGRVRVSLELIILLMPSSAVAVLLRISLSGRLSSRWVICSNPDGMVGISISPEFLPCRWSLGVRVNGQIDIEFGGQQAADFELRPQPLADQLLHHFANIWRRSCR